MTRLPVWLSRKELEWLAVSASKQLADRASLIAEHLKKREDAVVATSFNSTWDEPLEAELQSLRPILPIWELSQEQLKELYDYISAS